MWSIALPWPPPQLSPNARAHWSTRARIAARYKAACYSIAARSIWDARPPAGASVRLNIVFRPPTAAKRDLDNCVASIKAGIDGLAQALKVDDSQFTLSIRMGDPIKGGSVEIEISHEVDP